MRGIVLEGVSASGKSAVLNLIQEKILKEHLAATKLFISEHYTQRMLEHELEAGRLDSELVKKHVDKILNNLNTYETMLGQSKFANYPSDADTFVTIERFLFTFLATQKDKVADYSNQSAQRQLKKLTELNIKQYILVLPEGTLREHIERTLTHRNDRWADHVQKKGGIDGIVKESVEWQDNFLDLADRFKNSITTEKVSINDWNYQKVADYIFSKEYRS